MSLNLRREGSATLTLLDLMALHKRRKVDEEDIVDMLGENRRLDPMTGRAYGDGSITPVLPDVIPRPLRGNRQAKARRCFVQDSGVLQRDVRSSND